MNYRRRYTLLVTVALVLLTTISRTSAKNSDCQADTSNCNPEEILKRTPNYVLFQEVRDRRNRAAYKREQRMKQSAIPVNGFLAVPSNIQLPIAFAVGLFVGLFGSKHTNDCSDIHTMVLSVLLILYLYFIITGPAGLAVALSQFYACACIAGSYWGATVVGKMLA